MSILSVFEIAFWVFRFLSRVAYRANNTETASDDKSLAGKQRRTLKKRKRLAIFLKRKKEKKQEQELVQELKELNKKVVILKENIKSKF